MGSLAPFLNFPERPADEIIFRKVFAGNINWACPGHNPVCLDFSIQWRNVIGVKNKKCPQVIDAQGADSVRLDSPTHSDWAGRDMV
jgi:hypothetical protein